MFSIIMLCMSLSIPAVYGVIENSVTVSAEEQTMDVNNSVDTNINTNVKSLVIDKSDITIEHQGVSEFINVTGISYDGTQMDLTEKVEWISNDNSIVWAYDGRILAVNKGTTTVNINYGNLTEIINVHVRNSINVKNVFAEALSLAKSNNNNQLTSSQLTSIDRDAIVNKASDMVYMVWSGTDSVRGWRNEYTFLPGYPYTGMPYSQCANQVDDIQFYQKLYDSSSGFYSNYSRVFDEGTADEETIIMPKYGNDCSGFVSFSWGISKLGTSHFIEGIRNGIYPKVGNYDAYNPTYNDLFNSYQYLQPGDAVVKNGHTFIIVSSSSIYQMCYCYEQTPYYAVATFWDWSRLAQDGYMPFSIN
jgi:hypothetical protein